jgi:hypothetical protein
MKILIFVTSTNSSNFGSSTGADFAAAFDLPFERFLNINISQN